MMSIYVNLSINLFYIPFFNKYDIKPDVSWCLWSQQNNIDKWLDAESSRKSTEDAWEPRVW